MLTKLKKQSGQSVLELMIAMSIFVLVVSGIMFLVLDAQTANRQGGERTQAAFFTQEAFEATQSIANQGWRNLVDGDYGLDNSSGLWAWSGNSNIFDQFTRRITIAPVYRDGNGDIVATNGDLDFDTKRITVSTIWDFTTGRPSDVTLETLLTNWHSTKWLQSTQAEFNAGTLSNVAITSSDDGEIVLGQSTVSNYFDSPFDNPVEYTYAPTDIEVSSSQASLVNQGATQTGGTTNPGFDSTLTPWQYHDWDQGGGEVNVTGTRQASGGNPGGYALITIPRGRSDELGGYFEQSFSVTASNPDNAYVQFDGSVLDFNGTPSAFQVYVFLDNTSGEPSVGTEIWASGTLSSTVPWTSIGPIDVTSLVATTGTYYFKIAVWVETNSGRAGQFQVGFDNAYAYWEKIGSISYSTTNPSITPTTSFTSTEIDSWTGLQETATKNGGEIYYQLSDNDGATWQYWNGSAWANVSGATDYNTASVTNANISSFPATTKKLMFRAFLSSDGSQLVGLDNVRITYFVAGGVGYFISGDFISSTHDTGSENTIYNYIDWTIGKPANTDVQWQLRTADTQANLASATWVGVDGTGSTYYDTPGQIITTDPSASGISWVQYRAYLTGDSVVTPTIYDITIDYEQ